MGSGIRLAYAHMMERPRAMAAQTYPDRILVHDYIVEAEIGAFQAERGTKQRLRLNVVVEVTSTSAPVNDDVDRILSYDCVTEAINACLANERFNLLETLAERVAERVLARPKAVRAFVRIEKLDRGSGALGVEVVRERDQVEPGSDETAIPHPRIAFLANAVIASDVLSECIDSLEADGLPLILCVGPPDLPIPQSSHTMTQRRIDLLAIEQNAWTLAARDPRCKVVASRTELDWAIANGRTSVWAPSKIVLDAVEPPPMGERSAERLAAWFAGTFESAHMVVVRDTDNWCSDPLHRPAERTRAMSLP